MSVLLRPRWLALHLLIVAMVATCAGMSWWQFGRAEGGNGRSFGYALQWPGFGLFAVGVWIWLCRDAVRAPVRPGAGATPVPAVRVDDHLVLPPAGPATPRVDAAADPELAAYNDMLARLNERTTR